MHKEVVNVGTNVSYKMCLAWTHNLKINRISYVKKQ